MPPSVTETCDDEYLAVYIYIAFFLFTSVILLLQDSLTALTFGTGVCSHVGDLMPVEFVDKEKTIFVLKF